MQKQEQRVHVYFKYLAACNIHCHIMQHATYGMWYANRTTV